VVRGGAKRGTWVQRREFYSAMAAASVDATRTFPPHYINSMHLNGHYLPCQNKLP